MNKRITNGVLILSTLILLPSCSSTNRESSKAGSHHGKLDAMRIGEVYGMSGAHPLIGFVDPRAHTVYVAERATDRVKKALHVKEAKGQTWVIDLSSLSGEYKVVPLEALDLQQPLYVGMAAVNEKSTCLKTAKGECSNMYDAADNFSYSWKAPKDLFQCEWTKTQDCTDIWKEETIDVYPQKNCKGDPTSKKQTVAFCIPA